MALKINLPPLPKIGLSVHAKYVKRGLIFFLVKASRLKSVIKSAENYCHYAELTVFPLLGANSPSPTKCGIMLCPKTHAVTHNDTNPSISHGQCHNILLK